MAGNQDFVSGYTPESVVQFLLDNEEFRGDIYCPCARGGEIPRSLEEAGLFVVSANFDTAPLEPDDDFLAPDYDMPCSNIVARPPRGQACAFLRKAQAMDVAGAIAMLVPMTVLDDAGAEDVLHNATYPLKAVYAITDIGFAWLVFERNFRGPVIRRDMELTTKPKTDDFSKAPVLGTPNASRQTLPSVTLFSDIEPQPVEWLWADRIPLGEITLLDGDPGTNKSLLTLDLAARVSTGRPMPDGSPCQKAGVVMLQAEDSIRKTVRQRLEDAGADIGRVGVVERVVTIPEDLTVIEEAISRVHARLLLIDPLMVFLARNANKDQAVRQALTPLKELAERKNIAVLLVRHLNKTGGGHSMYRGSGSIGIIGAARSGLLVAPSPVDPGLRVVCHYKSNLGPPAPSLLFEPVDADNRGVRIEWRGECQFTARDLLRQPKEHAPALDTAKQYLRRALADGPKEANEVTAGAAKLGLSLRTLERAKRDLEVVAQRKGFGPDGVWYWALPERPDTDEPTDTDTPPDSDGPTDMDGMSAPDEPMDTNNSSDRHDRPDSRPLGPLGIWTPTSR